MKAMVGRLRVASAVAIAVLVLGAILTTPQHSEAEFQARVIAVLDGDTIEVLSQKHPVRVRVKDIDAPERGQPFGKRARRLTAELVFGETVRILAQGRDGYGRVLAEVIAPDGRNLGRELIRHGLAWHYKRYSNGRELTRLENEARAARRGLWTGTRPIPPWEYRRAQTHR